MNATALNPSLLLWIALLPLLAALIAGLAGRVIGRTGAAAITIAAVTAALVLSCIVFRQVIVLHAPVFDGPVYTWLISDGIRMQVGFLVDSLTVMMMVVVTFVSLCVHVYTIGYMHDDPGYQRFFSYISLFTFAMLMLVMSNNFLQLFFGWEAVGVVSYLLIGFWYTRPTAIFANMKAFLVNRVGDLGFLLGIAGVVYFTGSLQYQDAFGAVDKIAGGSFQIIGGHSWNALTVVCICLFIGAMGKSAQMPLHVWLPDSMEGPTPISALIHAATMVTAGIFMVARMSPLFEGSEAALSFVLVIGATTAFFMGLLGIVQNDIKRVVAYSTLSQLGYMTAALGASGYAAGVYHLMTHAFFKALLFLAAGAVIIAMHHEQDMRKMGGLAKRMPVTAITAWVGALALIGTPFFSGFYSKDALIEAVHHAERWGSGYAHWALLLGVFVTAFYTFRMIFMTFHGQSRMDHHAEEHFHDVGWDMKGPLVALAIPSLLIGLFTVGPWLFGTFFEGAIHVRPDHDVVEAAKEEFHGVVSFALHGLMTLPFWLAAAGVATAWYFVLKNPAAAASWREKFAPLVKLFENKYYFDWFNENVIARLSRGIGNLLWGVGDRGLIDGALVNGSAKLVGVVAGVVRRVQTGFLYSYAFWMVIGLALLLLWALRAVLGGAPLGATP
ncbi:MAG: NADH-quinone oxidoreductase subunit L [Nevskiaceae bacterium]|jgi:NADH-quinone oxidoreductase subunit L|nr:NADH-quinone oxidoreductase subunit L [Nevskiaceae bacterium]